MVTQRIVFFLNIFFFAFFVEVESQYLNVGYQSLLSLSDYGSKFIPRDSNALILEQFNTNNMVSCFRSCHENIHCTIFNYDQVSHECQLFEGDIVSMGSINRSSSIHSIVGSMIYDSTLFVNYGQPCSSCVNHRYLICTDGLCSCPSRMFFDENICQSQKLSAQDCRNDSECRQDLNFTCLSIYKCGSETSFSFT